VGLATVALAGAACGSDHPVAARMRDRAQDAALANGDTTGELIVEGATRRYLLHVPPGYQPGTPMPLVLNLHGLNESAAQQERVSGMSEKADQAGFIIVYPEGEGSPQRWNVGPREGGQRDLAFIRALIDHLAAQLSVDPARVYATGISNGGGMVNRLGCELADRIAAIAPVSGDYQRYEDCHPPRPVPVVAFHGTADPIIPYNGNRFALPSVPEWEAAWAERNGCAPTSSVTYQQGEVTGRSWDGCRAGATVTLYTIGGGRHNWPGRGPGTRDVDATDAIWTFFAAHPMP
jgi:polyhydroxybutyrate depolymerase